MDIVNSKKFPLTPSQLDIFLDQQRAPDSCMYTIGGYFQLVGTLDPCGLLSAISQVIRAESAFHLHLDLTDGLPQQYLVNPEQLNIVQIDFYAADGNKAIAQTNALRWLENNFSTTINLASPLYQVALLKISTEEYWLYLKTHHLIMDGWSYSLFIRRVMDYYHNNDAPAITPTWREYIQTRAEKTGNTPKHQKYWQERLAVYPGLPLLQRANTNAIAQKQSTIRHQFLVSKTAIAPLLRLAESHNASGFHAILALIYCYFLRAYGIGDLIIGTPLHGRNNAINKKIIGMFAGTSPTRINALHEITFPELLKQIQQQLARDFRHQEYSLGQIHRDVNSQGERRERLYDVFMSYEDFSYSPINTADIHITPRPLTHRQDQTPFTLFIRQYNTAGDFEFDMQLRHNFFVQSDAQWIEGRIRQLIDILPIELHTPLHQLEWLPDYEIRALQTINHTSSVQNHSKHMLAAFAHNLKQNPEKIAVIACDQQLSYQELDQASTAFSYWLRTQGIARGHCVGVSMDRTSHLLIVLLGIWKAGAAYIPLDPEYPTARLQQVIGHSQLQWVITQENYSSLFIGIDINCCAFSPALLAHFSKDVNLDETLFASPSLRNLAYVIYTSGSTGTPKGVAIEHSSLANFLTSMANTPGISTATNLLAVTTISFDIHILELFLPLVSGATVVLATGAQTRDAFALQDLMQTYNINMMQATPATWKMLFHADWQPNNDFKALCGGEALPPMLLEKFNAYPCIELWNMYGPTEATVWSSTALLKGNHSHAIHLGNPIANSYYFVLDKSGYPTGFNLPGELYIGGDCLAREYIYDAAKTATSFLWQSLPGQVSQRIYKTGDSVELCDNHQLYFRNRNDDQVKVRGYRIELGDIETALMKHPALKDAAVKIWRDARDENYLAAYCVATSRPVSGEALLSDETLLQFLAQQIPDYMIPASIHWLDALPLTPNGKIDRKQLVEPQLNSTLTRGDAPVTILEKTIATLWQELLAVQNPQRQDDFFRLGGDSIINIQQVSRLRKQGINAEAADIFRHSRLADFAQLMSQRQKIAQTTTDSQHEQTEDACTPFPLASAQQRLYVLQQMETTGTAYNMHGAFLIKGELNTEQLEIAFTRLINRHQPLHSTFVEFQGELLQQPATIDHFVLDQQLLTEGYAANSADWLNKALTSFIRPFDLSRAPLVRAQLWQSKEISDLQILLIDLHHLIADGLSINLFLHELFALYEQAPLIPLRANYRHFIQQQSAWLNSNEFVNAEHYWQQQFSGELTSLDFPTDFIRPTQQQFSGRRLLFSLTPNLSKAIKNTAQEHGLSLFMLLLAAYNVLLAKYTGREDIIVGTPVNNRPDGNFEHLIGLFVNTLPLRHYPAAEKSLSEFLQEVKINCSEAFRHKHYPFEKLVEDLSRNSSLTRDFSRNPLFDCALVLQAETLSPIATGNLEISPLPIAYQQAKFDLTLDIVDKGTHVQFEVEYATSLFEEKRIQRVGQHFINLLQQIVEHPTAQLGELDIVDNEERHELLHHLNDTVTPYPSNQTLISIFERQVDKTPEHTAIGFAKQHFSYLELNRKANQLAHHLIAHGIGKNQIVAVMLERSLEMPVAILAIIKAGAAYLPIAPSLPQERIDYMLADSGAPVLISHTNFLGRTAQFTGNIFAIDDDALFIGSVTNPELQSGPDDIAYVIYTSGSTGRPKGAMIEHRAVVNRIYWMQEKYPLSATDVILQKTPYTFDVSVWELFWWSFAGASVYFLAPEAEKDPQQIFTCISEQKISILHFVPSMLTASLEFLAAQQNNNWQLASLRYVFASGEALNPYQVEAFNHQIHSVSGAQLINLYGPTEAAIDVTWFDCPVSGPIKRVPIGKPIANIRLYILDQQQQLAPRGTVGELYISGIGVGRGYVNKPELTAEKFLADPFMPGLKMYRTGDLCRWLDDGNIEYLGRLDHQVKIRGNRIELGEIETRLLNYKDLREAVVVALKNSTNQDYLCAYLVARRALDIDNLRAYLAETLPDYMVPGRFVILEHMPLNASGKVDRKQLPVPQYIDQTNETIIDDTLLSATERQLLSIVRELLSNNQLGPADNFFLAGGDSIRAIQFSARVAQAGAQISIRDIFKYPTVKQLATAIEHSLSVDVNASAPIESSFSGVIGLTPIQHAFFAQNLPESDIYCQYVIINAPEFKQEKLQAALSLLLQQHPLLRAHVNSTDQQHSLHIAETFRDSWADDQFIQQDIATNDDAVIRAHLDDLNNNLQARIQLGSVLYAAGLLSTGEHDYLMIMIHHLIVDGVSWRILLDDLHRYYQCLLDAKPVTVLPQYTSPNEWINHGRACVQNAYLQKQYYYWQTVQETIAPALIENLHNAAGNQAGVQIIQHRLNAFETTALLTKTNLAYGTDTQDLLITAFTLAWQQWTGKIRVALDLESHGRQLPFKALDMTHSVGWFTAIFPWVMTADDIGSGELLPEKIMQVKESLRQIPDKGIGYSLLKYFGTETQQQNLHTGKPDILFNYLGHLDTGNPAWQLHDTGLVSAPHNPRSHLFEIIIAIKAGILEWSIHYPTTVFSSDSVLQFNALLHAQLLTIIDHCSTQSQPQVTPSDLGDAHIPLRVYQQWQQQFSQAGPITGIYKLTPTQAGIFFHAQTTHYSNQSEPYYEELGFYVNQPLMPARLQIALDQVSQQHCILRSIFTSDGIQEPRQLVCKNSHIQLIAHDISIQDKAAQHNWIEQLKKQTRQAGFNWQQPLFQLQLIKTGAHESMLLFSYHHLILDGWSCAVLIEELLKIYLELDNGKNLPALTLAQKKPDFDDYLRWLYEQNPESAQDYWRHYLTDISDKTRLPGEMIATESTYDMQEAEYQLPAEYLQGLNQLAAKYEVTLNTLLQAAWGLLLQRYNNSDETLFVSVVSGRTAPLPGIEKMLGLFINSMPVRIAAPVPTAAQITTNAVVDDTVITHWLQGLQINHLQSEHNSFIGLAEIARAANISSDRFRQLLVFENYPVNSKLDNSLHIDRVSLFEQTHYDFNLLIQPADTLKLRFIVNGHAHSSANVARIAGHLTMLLRNWVDAGSVHSSQDIVTTDEFSELINLGTISSTPIIASDNLVSRFLTQQKISPAAIAVCDERGQLDYAGLARQAHQITQHLLAYGVTAEQPVALLANRSCTMVAALLGILQAGAVVVPIDPHLPAERIHYLLTDSTSTCVLVDEVNSGIAQKLPALKQLALTQLLTTDVTAQPLPVITGNNLLYIIYTSGTTGNPKGVMLEHRNLLALIDSQKQDGLLTFNQRVLQFATHSFDVCYQEIFSTLLAGGCLYIIDEQLKKDADYLLAFIKNANIDTVFLPTAYLKFLFSVPERLEQIPDCLAHIITAGEQLLVSPTLRRYLQNCNVLLHNHYGPSETHVVSTQILSRYTALDDIPAIGKPVAGTSIYLLGQHGHIQPRGAIGEIFIGGANVGRGYWRNLTLTRERFLTLNDFYQLTGNTYFSSTEFLARNGERIYRTGDLGYWNQKGELIYLGRADQQVKIRGYRIELGEIEACLRKQTGVNEAAVIVCRDPQGNNYLVAYLVLDATAETAIPADIQLDKIKRNLANQLPAYMQPAFVIPLAQLPMTPNGKLDKRALPTNESTHEHKTATLENALQIRLAELWQQLLGADFPQLDTNFFMAGGHSLNAASLAVAIAHEWNIKISISDIFSARTLQQQAEFITARITNTMAVTANKLAPSTDNITQLQSTHALPNVWFPLSSAQQRLYVLDQLAGCTTNYNIPFVAKIHTSVDVQHMENALHQLLERHSLLGARIAIHNGQPMQMFSSEKPVIQTHSMTANNLDNYLATWSTPFDLHHDTLIRIQLLHITDTHEHWLLMDIHHIIADGVSIGILLRDLLAFYRYEELPPPTCDYSAVVNWQQEWLCSNDYQVQKQYWLNRFRHLPPVLELPLDFPRPPERSTDGNEFSLLLNNDLVHRLEQFSQQQGISIFAIALAAYALWLWRYSGETDMVIGIPVSGRSQAGFAQIPGLMVNSLALRVQLNEDESSDIDQTAQQFVQKIAAQLLEDLQHQDYPFDALVNALELPRDSGRNALFDTMFSFGNDWLENSGASELFLPQPLPVTQAKFDLAMSLDLHQGQYALSLNYATRLFTTTTAEQMARHYLVLLQQLLEYPQHPISKLNCLNVVDYQQLTSGFNNTHRDYPRHSTIALEFEKIVARCGNTLAVYDDQGSFTYAELNQLANQIGQFLLEKGLLQTRLLENNLLVNSLLENKFPAKSTSQKSVQTQLFVGVRLERSRYWLAAMMGIFKAGAIYLPIAPEWPEERVRMILEDATTPLLICERDNAIDVGNSLCEFVYLDTLLGDSTRYSTENLAPRSTATDLAYAIYTSGSTGIPKGVLVEQRGVLNLAQWAAHEYDLQRNSRMLQLTSPGFDVSIEETIVPLLNGASVFVLADEQKMDKQKFTRFVQQHHINIAEIVPSLLNDYLLDNIPMESLTLVITGAERLDPHLKDQILSRGYRLHNVYGPTETTVNATSKSCALSDDTIGKPMANSQAFIVDRCGRVQPIGVAGELCISGDNLARGYHQREQLTRETFIANPFVAGTRLYRTGDLAKWTSNGEIRFIGRIDQQIKIRGYRIEIGDIENRLINISGVTQAIVTVHNPETANASLCAYYTGPEAQDENILRKQLTQWLPDYMLPAHFVYLSAIPLTANGKVDKNALPQPERNIRTDFLPPRTGVEQQLEKIWCTLLNGDNYSIDEDFFRVGGHSLLAIKLLAAINQQWNITINLTEIFTHSTLEKLASLIEHHNKRNKIASTGNCYSVINPQAEKTVFLFPPALGENLIYGQLSQCLPDYRFYCFNYLDDVQRLEIYADTIEAAANNDKIYLFGYSAGGNLAFEVARTLEARGHHVGGLILLDSVRRQAFGLVPERAQIAQNIREAFARNTIELNLEVNNELFIQLVDQAYRYGIYIENLVNTGKLNTNVHLIKAHTTTVEQEDYGWGELANNLSIYAGSGDHLDMLASGKNLAHNAEMIKNCLESGGNNTGRVKNNSSPAPAPLKALSPEPVSS